MAKQEQNPSCLTPQLMHYSEALQLNQPYVILPSIQEINTMNASDLFLNAMTTFSPALNLQGFHSSADLESILMSNYLLTDEGRDTQELPPSHLSVQQKQQADNPNDSSAQLIVMFQSSHAPQVPEQCII